MALNIPNTDLPGNSFLKGIDTGSTMFSRLMQPVLEREKQKQQQEQQHSDSLHQMPRVTSCESTMERSHQGMSQLSEDGGGHGTTNGTP